MALSTAGKLNAASSRILGTPLSTKSTNTDWNSTHSSSDLTNGATCATNHIRNRRIQSLPPVEVALLMRETGGGDGVGEHLQDEWSKLLCDA
jgi:hypothetical protein